MSSNETFRSAVSSLFVQAISLLRTFKGPAIILVEFPTVLITVIKFLSFARLIRMQKKWRKNQKRFSFVMQ